LCPCCLNVGNGKVVNKSDERNLSTEGTPEETEMIRKVDERTILPQMEASLSYLYHFSAAGLLIPEDLINYNG
jgi:hypothetical protein